MKLRVYDDKVCLSGYVNVAERISKRLREHGKEFYEKVKEGAFGDAIRRNNNIKLLLNHDNTRELASGNELDIYEDSIGLYVNATVTDEDVIKKARSNELVGWSFGFSPLKESINESYGDIPLRSIESLNLYEVSILDNNHIPAYNSMSLEVRGFGSEPLEIINEKDINIEIEERATFDNSIFINKINDFLNERKK